MMHFKSSNASSSSKHSVLKLFLGILSFIHKMSTYWVPGAVLGFGMLGEFCQVLQQILVGGLC